MEYLKEERGINLNSHLTESQTAVARAFQKMTEENLYWTMCLEMFGEDTTAVESVIPYRGVKLWFTLWFLRRVIQKETWGHGIGRHTPDEVWSIAVGDMTAISDFLGEKKFFMGDEPCEVDCAMFGMLTMIICNMPTSKHERFLKDNLQNLEAYFERMKARFWPDWDQLTLKGDNYVNDHGKLYNFDHGDSTT
ncbi:hypothetical protein FSP39_020029 [Pinctada imbricata]|uniref:Failed axon connections-like protein n=1 Tax=Pinctada imbricata TaxID=66713 RepID=A0AA89C1T1_PINIB|nr:hypothetical protein FSP39_020029 [Pinctada imbricata]